MGWWILCLSIFFFTPLQSLRNHDSVIFFLYLRALQGLLNILKSKSVSRFPHPEPLMVKDRDVLSQSPQWSNSLKGYHVLLSNKTHQFSSLSSEQHGQEELHFSLKAQKLKHWRSKRGLFPYSVDSVCQTLKHADEVPSDTRAGCSCEMFLNATNALSKEWNNTNKTSLHQEIQNGHSYGKSQPEHGMEIS